jgi:hypothetical protein
VHVLLLRWEHDDLGVAREITKLKDVFERCYNFNTEEWNIPPHDSHIKLAGRLFEFLNISNAEDKMLIVYYGGHGEMDNDRRCVWRWYVFMRCPG